MTPTINKELENKAMIYDDNCPMCKWYTGQFVRANLLKTENRIAFSSIDVETNPYQLDWNRSRHEIPLIDLKGGKTIYGLDSLLFILSQRLPFIAWLFQFKPLYIFFQGFYSFVSYNRRVIITSKIKPVNFDCTPDFSLTYRLLFVLFTFGIACLAIIKTHLPNPAYYILPLLLFYLAHLFFFKFNLTYRTELTGQLSVTVIITSLLSFPFISLSNFFHFAILTNVIITLPLLIVFTLEYTRRINIFLFNYQLTHKQSIL